MWNLCGLLPTTDTPTTSVSDNCCTNLFDCSLCEKITWIATYIIGVIGCFLTFTFEIALFFSVVLLLGMVALKWLCFSHPRPTPPPLDTRDVLPIISSFPPSPSTQPPSSVHSWGCFPCFNSFESHNAYTPARRGRSSALATSYLPTTFIHTNAPMYTPMSSARPEVRSDRRERELPSMQLSTPVRSMPPGHRGGLPSYVGSSPDIPHLQTRASTRFSPSEPSFADRLSDSPGLTSRGRPQVGSAHQPTPSRLPVQPSAPLSTSPVLPTAPPPQGRPQVGSAHQPTPSRLPVQPSAPLSTSPVPPTAPPLPQGRPQVGSAHHGGDAL